MKRTPLHVGFIAVLVAGICLVGGCVSRPQLPLTTRYTSPIPPPYGPGGFRKALVTAATVVWLQGIVQVRDPDGGPEAWRPLALNERLPVGCFVRTGLNGFARIRFGQSGEVFVGKGSKIAIEGIGLPTRMRPRAVVQLCLLYGLARAIRPWEGLIYIRALGQIRRSGRPRPVWEAGHPGDRLDPRHLRGHGRYRPSVDRVPCR